MKKLRYYLLSLAVLSLSIGIFSAIIFLVLSLPGARDSQEIPTGAAAGFQKELTVEDLQARSGLPIYWLGETYRGLPIVNIQHQWDPGPPNRIIPPREYVSIIYASCRPGQSRDPVQAEGYCGPDEFPPTYIDVTSEWLCLKPPTLLAEAARQGPQFEARGALVQPTTGNIHFFFGQSTVIISASEGKEVSLEAFNDLVGLNPPARVVAPAASTTLAPPMAEEDCRNFVLPTPYPTATPEPTIASTATPTVPSTPVTSATPIPGAG